MAGMRRGDAVASGWNSPRATTEWENGNQGSPAILSHEGVEGAWGKKLFGITQIAIAQFARDSHSNRRKNRNRD